LLDSSKVGQFVMSDRQLCWATKLLDVTQSIMHLKCDCMRVLCVCI